MKYLNTITKYIEIAMFYLGYILCLIGIIRFLIPFSEQIFVYFFKDGYSYLFKDYVDAMFQSLIVSAIGVYIVTSLKKVIKQEK